MFTEEEMRAGFDKVLDRMTVAGWLHSHTYTVGKGHFLTWTERGHAVSGYLRLIAESFRLDNGDAAPVAFGVVCQGQSFPGFTLTPEELDPELRKFWCDHVGELGLHGDEDGLLVLVQVLKGWATLPERPQG
jgi:hypothetical protein